MRKVCSLWRRRRPSKNNNAILGYGEKPSRVGFSTPGIPSASLRISTTPTAIHHRLLPFGIAHVAE
eukprot:417561-Pyramimonas_sp.AAC.1